MSPSNMVEVVFAAGQHRLNSNAKGRQWCGQVHVGLKYLRYHRVVNLDRICDAPNIHHGGVGKFLGKKSACSLHQDTISSAILDLAHHHFLIFSPQKTIIANRMPVLYLNCPPSWDFTHICLGIFIPRATSWASRARGPVPNPASP